MKLIATLLAVAAAKYRNDKKAEAELIKKVKAGVCRLFLWSTPCRYP